MREQDWEDYVEETESKLEKVEDADDWVAVSGEEEIRFYSDGEHLTTLEIFG